MKQILQLILEEIIFLLELLQTLKTPCSVIVVTKRTECYAYIFNSLRPYAGTASLELMHMGIDFLVINHLLIECV